MSEQLTSRFELGHTVSEKKKASPDLKIIIYSYLWIYSKSIKDSSQKKESEIEIYFNILTGILSNLYDVSGSTIFLNFFLRFVTFAYKFSFLNYNRIDRNL